MAGWRWNKWWRWTTEKKTSGKKKEPTAQKLPRASKVGLGWRFCGDFLGEHGFDEVKGRVNFRNDAGRSNEALKCT